jgi:hypothetical protein
MKSLLKLLSVLVFALVLMVQPVSAAEQQSGGVSLGLAVSPPTFELSANPGDKLERSIRVDNLVDKPIPITVDRRNFAALGEEGQAVLTEEVTPFSLASWIKVDPTTVTIPAKASHVFKFTVAVPANAEPGGHFGSIVFRTLPPSPSQSGGYAVGQEIGSLLLLKIAGNAREQAQIESFQATRDFWESGPIEFESRIKNLGNIHIKPTASITISDMFGRKVAVVPVDPLNVLPNSTRRLPAVWKGQGLFGRYTATLSVSYGDKQQIITSTTSFTVIPYKPIVATLLVGTLIGFIIYRGRRRIARSLKILFAKDIEK